MSDATNAPFCVEPQAEMRPGMIELRWGDPDPALLPVEAVAAAARRALEQMGPAALNYGVNEGPGVLRAALRQRIAAHEGVEPAADELAITAGNSAALNQLLALLVRPDDVVLVEDPSYSLALRMARDLSIELAGVPFDAGGLVVEALPALVRDLRRRGKRPRLLYTIPTFHNPTGICLAPERRTRLLEIAAAEDMLVVEDDVYRELAYAGAAPPSLWSLARQIPAASGQVLRLGTFSKTLAPGLRCGWLTASSELTLRFAHSGVFDSGGCPSQFTACLIASMLLDGGYDQNVARVRSAYAQRCLAVNEALERELPSGCEVTRPRGGYFTWVRLPEGLSAAAVLPLAEERGVSFVGGPRFSVGGDERGIRLGFSMYPPQTLRRGVSLLAEAIRAAMA